MALLHILRRPKKGNAQLLTLALLVERPRHGYEIGKLIAEGSEGVLRFHVASLYPLLGAAGSRANGSLPLAAAGATTASLRPASQSSPSSARAGAPSRGAVNRIVEVRHA